MSSPMREAQSAFLEAPVVGTLHTLFVRTFSLEWGKAIQGTGVCDALAGSYHTALLCQAP